MNRISNSLVLIGILFSFASAQITTQINISSTYDDNLLRSHLPESDFVSDLGLNILYSPGKSNLRYFLNPDYFKYQINSTRNFFMNRLGFNNQIALNEEKNKIFYFGAEWDIRMNGSDYDYYDYNQLYAYANFNYNKGAFFLKSGYNYRYRSYSNIPELTNNRHYVFIQGNSSFPTRTSLILEADAGYKSFGGQELYALSGGGRGAGRMGGGYSTYSATQIPSLSQAVFLARVAQSIYTKMGIYIQYRKQISLNSNSSYSNQSDYYQDEELFDDPFSYESDQYSSQLTWMLPWNLKLQTGFSLSTKTYISENAFLSAEDSIGLGGIRKDEQKNFNFSLSKKFFPRKAWLKSLSIALNYSYILNESNSYWYDYKNNFASAGIRWNF